MESSGMPMQLGSSSHRICGQGILTSLDANIAIADWRIRAFTRRISMDNLDIFRPPDWLTASDANICL